MRFRILLNPMPYKTTDARLAAKAEQICATVPSPTAANYHRDWTPAMDYNEDDILTTYIWNHYTHLMTDFERRVGTAIIARTQAEHSSDPHMVDMLRRRWGGADAPAINAALQHGNNVFRQQVCQRLLAEYGDQIFINRCPVCQRIVRTPKAHLCVWCGHSWFEQTRS